MSMMASQGSRHINYGEGAIESSADGAGRRRAQKTRQVPGYELTCWDTAEDWFYAALGYLPILMIVLGTFDMVLDMVLVSDLAGKDEKESAAMLGVFTMVPFVFTLATFPYIHLSTRHLPPQEGCVAWEERGSFNMEDPKERINFFVTVAAIQLSHFLLEDATTFFVWWHTGLYLDDQGLDDDGDGDPSSLNVINMAMSLLHAIVALICMFILFYQATGKDIMNDTEFVTSRKDLCTEKPLLYMILPFIMAAIGIFWTVFPFVIIMDGVHYDKRNNRSIGSNKGIAVMYTFGVLAALQGFYIAYCRLQKMLLPRGARHMVIPEARLRERPLSVDFSLPV